MSDLGRKDLSSQIGDKVTPDSQKSTLEQTKENVTGAGDRIAGAVQPEQNKSATQKLGDSTRSGKDDASNQGQGILASAQETIGNAAQAVQDTIAGNKK